jgi:hypothetical protein
MYQLGIVMQLGVGIVSFLSALSSFSLKNNRNFKNDDKIPPDLAIRGDSVVTKGCSYRRRKSLAEFRPPQWPEPSQIHFFASFAGEKILLSVRTVRTQ